ncbi:transcription factor, putative [Rhizoctonia solani AG-3 Rhs1AP]|uniref:Transcription factor, putative n=2 Tax=Rhizoctonia solani AG-3 TaxID=1086053 RepID=X8IZA4_9AGAM|nr:transcription factor, putative [Rhizoctonia solani AG-3 Rhs1AP]
MMRSLSPQSTTGHLNNYSPLLHCSLLTFASTFSDNPYIKANDVRAKFATQAKGWLFDQFGDFHPTLLPSLVLLAGYHNGIGERNTGYMYLGMGVRATKAAPISTNISTHTWYSWSVYAQGHAHNLIEAFSALESGRSNQMPLPRIPIDFPTEHLGDHSSLEAETFVRSCKLAVIATEVNRNTPGDSSSVAELQLQIDAWYNSLPHRLLISQRATFTHSHVFCLHIAYWWITLQLHLPLYRQGQTKDSSIGQDRSIKMCNRATENLVQLFTEFDKRYTLRYFPGNLLQAMALCGDALLLERVQTPGGAPKKRAKAQEGIDSCIRALQAAGETWSHARNLSEQLQARAAE